jgi:hypothetical protein
MNLYTSFNMGDSTEYDVSKYNDEELFEILDVNNPSDRELEAKILQLIEQYGPENGTENKQLVHFFEDIYQHFFENSEDEETLVENMENMNAQDGKEDHRDHHHHKEYDEKEETQVAKNSRFVKADGSANKRTTYVSNLEYGPSKLNPLLKEVMKRVIFIDSQFREYNTYPSSTNFRFDLSEPLHNVVSLKLHSISIPYTWYNISNMYNANYFLLEGNVAAITTKKIVIPIEAGIYDEPKLVNTINLAITAAKTKYSDVDFGTTQVTYSSVHNKIKIDLDITYVQDGITYHAKDFKLIFFKPDGESNQRSVEQNYDFEFVTWNVTLGWVLGYRSFPEFVLNPNDKNNSKYVKQNDYTYDSTSGIITLKGDACLDLNTCKTMYLILNDHTNHHLNDGLVTISARDNKHMPHGYINRARVTVNPSGETLNVSTQSSTPNVNLNANQLYAANEVVYNDVKEIQNAQIYADPPFLKDNFGIIPIKLGGLKPGQLYSEFGGGLLENNRIYFGPVNIKKMDIQLMNDKGDIINLNNANWNFSLVVEYLYNYNRT